MTYVQGSIFVYGSIPDGTKFKVLEGKPTVHMVLNIFRYPPGQEPRKTGDDGKGGKKQLPEKEENSSLPKVPPFATADFSCVPRA